jgi:opacity protein-like surface antigen
MGKGIYHMKKQRFLKHEVTFLLLLLPCVGYAGENGASKNWRVLTLSAGPAWYQTAQAQTPYIQPDFPNTYITKKDTYLLGDGEIFAGFQRTLPNNILGQLGITVAATTSADEEGNVWEFGDPNFDNFTYQYHMTHVHVAVKGKVLSTQFSDKNLPYITGSAGVGFNRAYDYSTTPLIFEAVSPPNFQTNTETTFTYTLGVGVQRILTPHTQVGVGYEFADWGKSALLAAAGQPTRDVLQLNHLYTNQLQFNVTYLG